MRVQVSPGTPLLNMITKYVLGFLFNEDLTEVVLIRKNKPEWQADLLNGVGGKIEDSDENALGAMIREFSEETGYTCYTWKHFLRLQSSGDPKDQWMCDCFATKGDVEKTKTVTDEEVIIVFPCALDDEQCVENLKWIIELAIDHLDDGKPEFVIATYP